MSENEYKEGAQDGYLKENVFMSLETGDIEGDELLKENVFTLKVVTNAKDFDALEEGWKELADNSDTYIFQTYQWNRIWWKYFGVEGRLNIITVYEKDTLIGIIPLFRDAVKIFGSVVYECLRFLGSNVSQPEGKNLLGLISYTNYLDAVIQPGYELPVYTCLSEYISEHQNDFDEIIFDVVPETSTIWSILLPMLIDNEIKFNITENEPSQLVDVKGSWQNYLSSLSKNRRYQTRLAYKRAMLDDYKVFDIEKVAEEEELLSAYEQFVKMHQRKWNSYGSLGSFYEERFYEFDKEVALTFFRKGWLQLLKAVPVDDKSHCAAMDLNYVYKGRICGVHGAMDDDSPYYKQGPGAVLLAVTLEEAIRNKIEVFDFLRGTEPYKLMYSTREMRNRTISITNIESPDRIYRFKKYLMIRRQLVREFETIKMFFRKDSFGKALKSYVSFMKRRIQAE